MFELVILFLNDIIYISLYFYFFILFLWFLYIYSKNSEVYKFEVFIYFKIYFFLLIVGLIYLVYINPINIWYSFDFIIYFDYLSRFIILFFLIAFSCFLFIFIKLKMEFFYYFEYLFILMLSIFIVNFLFKVFDLMLLFILLEAFSLCLYILVSSNYTTIKISEIGIKYYVIAVISSLFFLYGIILLYFNFGTFNIMKIKILMLLTPKFNESLILILLFLLGSLFFKLGVAPFHLWVVEVYVNVNLVTFFYLSVFSKFVFFIIFFKLILYFLMYYYSYYYYLFLIMGLLSIIIGSIGALIYVDIKKILAYGSIVHSGFLILSFINISYYSFYAFLFYLLVYVILMLNFFLFFFLFKTSNFSFLTLYDFISLKMSSKFICFNLFFLFLSMAGFPPFVGFFIKLSLIYSLYSSFYNTYFVILFLLILNLISLYIYLRFGIYLFFSKGNFKFLCIKKIRSLYYLTYFFFFFNIFGVIYGFYLYKYLYIYIYYIFLCFI